MRVALVVIVEPPGDLPEQCSSIRQWDDASVVALGGFDKGFSDAVRLRAVHWGEARHQAEGGGEVECLFVGVGTAIVGQPLDGVWRLGRAEAQFSTVSSIRSRTIDPLMPAPCEVFRGAQFPPRDFRLLCAQADVATKGKNYCLSSGTETLRACLLMSSG